MLISVRNAAVQDAAVSAGLVNALTREICEATNISHFDNDLPRTEKLCEELIRQGHYTVLLGYADVALAGIATITENYALYAGGKVGTVQELYFVREMRSSGIGAALLNAILARGKERDWAAIELCTPPLPQFEKTIAFYSRHGFTPVGGRKMRQYLSTTNSVSIIA